MGQSLQDQGVGLQAQHASMLTFINARNRIKPSRILTFTVDYHDLEERLDRCRAQMVLLLATLLRFRDPHHLAGFPLQ